MITDMDRIYDQAKKYMNANRINEGIRLLVNIAEQGHVASQRGLGIMYMFGQFDVPVDYEQAFRWFSRAAVLGCTVSACNLGVLYRTGNGTEQDSSKALYWFGRAAEQGDEWGEYNLAGMHKDGVGTEVDDEKAMQLFASAAQKGLAAAKCELAFMYLSNEGKNKLAEEDEYSKALVLLGESSEQGWEPAINVYPIFASAAIVKHDEVSIYEFDELRDKLAREHDDTCYYRGQTRYYFGPLLPSAYRPLSHSAHTFYYNGTHRLRNTGTRFHTRRKLSNEKPMDRRWQVARSMTKFVRNALGYPLAEAFSQQAGYQSEGLDVTSDVDVAFFFATHVYSNKKYTLNCESCPSVIYRWRLPKPKFGFDELAKYDFYNCPSIIPTEDIFDKFETCDTWEECYASILAYQETIGWRMSEFNIVKTRESRPLNIIKIPSKIVELSRIKKQRASLLLPDMILNQGYAHSVDIPPQNVHPYLPMIAIEDLAQKPNCEIFLFNQNPQKVQETFHDMSHDDMFGDIDVTHILLHGWMQSFLHESHRYGTQVMMDLKFDVSVNDIIQFCNERKAAGELFF